MRLAASTASAVSIAISIAGADALSLVRAAPFDEAIRYLEDSPDEPDDPGEPFRSKLVAHRGAVLGELVRRVHDAGDVLIRAAVEVAITGAPEDRRHAQLLLAQHPRLPRWAVSRLEGADSFEAWAFAQLHRRPNDDYLLELQRGDPGDSWYSPWPPPAQLLERELADRLALTPAELSRCNDEYQQSYAEHALPRLARLAELIDHSPGAAPDLDGDRDPEVVISCNFWEWDSETSWHDRMSFVALLDRASESAPWRVAAFERLIDAEVVDDVFVRDFDRDGIAEAAIRTRRLGRGAGAVRMLGLRTSSPLPRIEAGERSCRVQLLERSIEEPTRFFSSEYHVPSPVGRSGEAVGVLALARDAFVWDGQAFTPAETVYSLSR